MSFKSYFNNFLIFQKFKNLNRIYFPKKKFKSKKKFLVEFNAFHDFHAIYSIVTNYINIKKKMNVEAFFNYSLLSAPLNFNFLNSIKWVFGKMLSLGFFGIYKSFNVNEIFKPKIKEKHVKLATSTFNKDFKLLKNKSDVLKIKVKNVIIGDLIYDTYLKSRNVPTLEIKSYDFQKFYSDFLKLTFFWFDYFKNNDVEGIVTSHTTYTYGLPLRIAINFGISGYVFNSTGILKINKNNIFGGMYGDYKNYHKRFVSFKKQFQRKAIKESFKIIKKKFSGQLVNFYYETKSSFGNVSKERFLKKNKKTKVMICTHNFFDAVHIYGKGIFPDFYEWLNFLFKISNNTNFDWYVKNHPSYSGKAQILQTRSNKVVKELLKDYPHIKLLPNNLSNRQIIEEGIDVVLTSHGTVASEFPFFSVPVINAAPNPHSGYTFSTTPRNIKQYKKLIKNLDKIKFKKKSKKEIYEYYFMSRILNHRNWLTGDFDGLIKSVGSFYNLQSNNFYKFWLEHLDHKKKKYFI
mgnify:CR=1 FL=1|tara:strand:- start:995 stop:2548 length:1554 start_codon:yes stop_codon:yes gene_type:complete